MFSSVYRLIQEMALKYQQVPKVSEKYAFLTPLSLLDDHCECQIDEITTTLTKRSSWLREKDFGILLLSLLKEEPRRGKKALYKFCKFITKSNLDNSSPNIVLRQRNFSSITASVAACGRRFLK